MTEEQNPVAGDDTPLEKRIAALEAYFHYMNDKLQKEELGKELFPYYSALLHVLRRSNVFADGNALATHMANVTQSLAEQRQQMNAATQAVSEFHNRLVRVEENLAALEKCTDMILTGLKQATFPGNEPVVKEPSPVKKEE